MKGFPYVFKEFYIYLITQDLFSVVAITGFNRFNSPSKVESSMTMMIHMISAATRYLPAGKISPPRSKNRTNDPFGVVHASRGTICEGFAVQGLGYHDESVSAL
jgi:hypothetical protein